ncbi:hypothetical protein TNCV_481811 [Trichonephila clavipes]|nr:hypothetical protein TNCV_481811 [Trichonephila clavipes]
MESKGIIALNMFKRSDECFTSLRKVPMSVWDSKPISWANQIEQEDYTMIERKIVSKSIAYRKNWKKLCLAANGAQSKL